MPFSIVFWLYSVKKTLMEIVIFFHISIKRNVEITIKPRSLRMYQKQCLKNNILKIVKNNVENHSVKRIVKSL